MYKSIPERCAARVLSGGPIVTVSSQSSDGVADIMTAAWNCPFDSNIVQVTLDLGHTTSENIKNTGKFVLGIPSKDQVEEIMKAGSVHGRDVGDKFDKLSIPYEFSEKLGLKVLRDQLAYIECELFDFDIFAKSGICLGKAVSLYVQDKEWNDSEECFLDGAKHTLHHVKDNIFLCGHSIIEG